MPVTKDQNVRNKY